MEELIEQSFIWDDIALKKMNHVLETYISEQVKAEQGRVLSLLEGMKFGEKESSIGPNRHEYAKVNQTLDEAITKIKGEI